MGPTTKYKKYGFYFRFDLFSFHLPLFGRQGLTVLIYKLCLRASLHFLQFQFELRGLFWQIWHQLWLCLTQYHWQLALMTNICLNLDQEHHICKNSRNNAKIAISTNYQLLFHLKTKEKIMLFRGYSFINMIQLQISFY